MKTIQFEQNIPIRHEVDLLVAGGGPAGCAAAWAAAKLGARVLLLEEHTCLGGLGTAGMVPAFMHTSDGEHFLCSGFGTELLGRLYQDTIDLHTGIRKQGLSIPVEDLKRIYEELLQEAGVEFYFHSRLIGISGQEDGIGTAVFAAKSGLFAVKAKMFVDSTGDGDLSVMAGAGYDLGDEEGRTMAATLCSLWAGIDWTRVKKPDSREIGHAIADGIFSIPDQSLSGMWKISDTVGGGNIGHIFGIDATDERSLTRGLIRGREYMREYGRYYREYLTGYEQMELIATASLLGIRESRRIRCMETLTLDAFQTRAVFANEIGRYNYIIDIHPSNPSPEEFQKSQERGTVFQLGPGESYGIPYGALVPQHTKNLLVAGRCIGADKPMQGSIRVMPGCFITGQAAGAAAVLCITEGVCPAELDVSKLQKALLSLGAFLPNAQVE